jgi:hypothetical protein
MHGVGDLPHGSEIDVGLVYGDYYFLEALLRAFPRPQGPCSTTTTPSPAPQSAGPTTPAARSGGCSASGEVGMAAVLAAVLVLAVRRAVLAARRRSPP